MTFKRKKYFCYELQNDCYHSEHIWTPKKHFDLFEEKKYIVVGIMTRDSVLNYTKIFGRKYVGGLKNSLCVLNSQLERHNSSSVRNTTILMLVGRPVDAVNITMDHDVGRNFASSFSISCRRLIATVACLNCRV